MLTKAMRPSSFIPVFLLLPLIFAQPTKKCAGGSIVVGDVCKKCQRGTYRNGDRCAPCPKGFYNRYSGAHGVDVCFAQPCPKNTFGTVEGAVSKKQCKECPSGTSSNRGAPKCLSCEPGTRLYDFTQDDPSKAESCVRCDHNRYTSVRNARECLECPGKVEARRGSKSCTDCPAGFGGRDVVECKACGTSFNDGSSTECKQCPPGFIGDTPLADRCVPCPVGTFKEGFKGDCKRCPAGLNRKSSGATFCIRDDAPCPKDHFRNNLGACQTCLKGQKYVQGKRTCELCGINEESEGGLSKKCTACSPDKIGTLSGCECRAGYRTNADGSCTICPAGRVGKKNGRDSFCGSCFSFSQFTDADGSLSCKNCPISKFSNSDLTGCVSCPKGRVKGLRGQCVLPKTNCPPQTKRVLDPLGRLFTCSMKTCPQGQVKYFNKFRGIGKVFSCAKIRSGFFLGPPIPSGGFPARECPEDSVSSGGVDAVCRKCPDGLFRDDLDGSKCGCRGLTGFDTRGPLVNRGWINGRCEVCPPGTRQFYAPGPPTCIQCPAGSFQKSAGKRHCMLCAAGHFSSKPGSAKCERCPPGTTSYAKGSISCTPLA